MIRRSLRLMWTGAVLAFVAYILFFVHLGERTTFEHLMRVINTEEAKELGRDLSAATARLSKQIGDQVHDATKPPSQDAGTSQVPEVVSDKFQGLVGNTYARDEQTESALQNDAP
jgi:hypothetical protein